MERHEVINGEFKIEKGIPIPDRTSRAHKGYPWLQLEVGDSFVVPCDEVNWPRLQPRLAAGGRNFGKKHGRKFTTGRVDGGIRVWRVE